MVLSPLFVFSNWVIAHTSHLRYLTVCLLLLGSQLLVAQIEVHPDRPTAHYALGETARFVVQSPYTSGTATYSISADSRTPNYASGTIQVVAGQPTTIPYTPDISGIVTCTVNLNGQFAISSAGIGMDEIDSMEDEPSDFDAFWQNQLERAEAIPLDPQVSFYRTNNQSDTYRFSIANIDNRRMYGYITIPKGGGQYPAMITLPAYGEGANLTAPDEVSARVLRTISVSLSIHNVAPDNVDPNAYEPEDIANRENYYYKQAIIGIKRVIDYLHTRPDFDGQNLVVSGVSQGGGLATMIGGLDDRVDLIALSNPALAYHVAAKYGRPAGFPHYIWQSRVRFGTPTHETQTTRAAKYYDAVYFAKRYKNPALLTVGYRDEVTHPDGGFAIRNQWRDKVIFLHSLRTGHGHPAEYWDGRYDAIRRFVPAMRQQPYTGLGYVANAGEDLQVVVNGVLNMTGQVVQEYNVLNNLPVRWEKISGPGTVDFSHPNSYNTNVVFSAEGKYTLRFAADVTEQLVGEGKYYTLMDHVVVTVGQPGSDGGNDGNGDDNGDNDDDDDDNNGGDSGTDEDDSDDSGVGEEEDEQLVTTSLDLLTFDQWNNVDVQITFGEPSVGLDFADFEIVNGTIIGLSGWGEQYFIKVQPTSNRVEVFLPSNKTVAIQGGTPNAASNRLRIDINGGGSDDTGGVECQNVTEGGTVTGDESNCTAFVPTPIVNVTDATGGIGDIEYQWEQSVEREDGPWTVIGDTNTADYQPPTITQTTWYRRAARRDNCGNFATYSNTVIKHISTVQDAETSSAMAYCQVRAAQPWWQWIQKVQLGDFIHFSDKEGWGNFLSKQIELVQGRTYDLSLAPGFTWQPYEEYWRVWIDFNQDGDFDDSGELVFQAQGETEQQGTVRVPTDAPSGLTRMRVAMKNGANAESCESFTYGEIEEYTVLLKNGGMDVSSYCQARASQPWNHWIAQVQLAEINQYSNKEGYANFMSDNLATLASGQAFEMLLRPGFSYGTSEMYWRVWIDFNQDGNFSDANEQVLSVSSQQPINESIFVPENAAPGITRMRVVMQRNAFADACGTIGRGEVEDYQVRIRECVSERSSRLSPVLALTTWRSGISIKASLITNTEYKNDYFVLERATDGGTFTEIARSASTTDTYLSPVTYHFLDSTPGYGTNVYRIKQVYKNGLYIYSEQTMIDFDTDVQQITIFPNPVQSELFVNIPRRTGRGVQLSLVNLLGQVVQEQSIDALSSEVTRLPIPDELSNGLYYLHFEIAGEKSKVRPVLLQR